MVRLASSLILASCIVSGQTLDSITCEGVDSKPTTLSTEDLAKLPAQSVTVTDHGRSAVFNGALLSDVLARVSVGAGKKFHGKSGSYYVVVEARDGYRAVFAWAELDPAFTDRKVWLATKRDGKRLPDGEGPFRVVVPDDKKAGRWVRQVTAIRIRQAN